MNKDNCLFCNNSFKYASIKKYNHWDWQLFVDDQYYIGRCVIVLRGRHVSNINNINIDERNELFETVLPDVNDGLDNTFSPDLYNYSSLGNDCRHVHIHVIPRYKKPVEYDGEIYKDEFWNQTYSQDYKRIKFNNEELKDLIEVIKSNM